MRLDRLLGQSPTRGRQKIKTMLARKQIRVDGETVVDGQQEIGQFSTVTADGQLVQCGKTPHYIMLNKSTGVVSATWDPDHDTVMGCLPETVAGDLHIAGRLDRASTGLLLLTNDGLWSRRLTAPELKKPKVYHVMTEHPIAPETRQLFSKGIYFPYEGITTSPAQLEQLGSREARLTIYEGRYHQIKRMFGRFRNPVIHLHRESMGEIILDPHLAPGEHRALTPEEIASV